MWQIKQIEAENFMSFEKVQFSFENNCYIVLAQNLDNEGQKSNGGGKTSFIDIISVALLGYSLTGRNVKDCVNWNIDSSFFTVTLYMENPKHNLNCFIQRKVYTKSKGQELILLVNEEPPKILPSKAGVNFGVDVKAGNEYIINELLDISPDDLLNYFLISSQYYTPFLKVNTDRKLAVIARFSKADIVDRVIESLEVDREVHNDNIEEHKTKISKIEGHIEALDQSLTGDAAKQFEQDKLDQIKLGEQKQTEIEISINGLEEKIQLLEKENSSIEFEDVDTDEGVYHSASLASAKNALEKLSKELTDEEKAATRIEVALSGMVTCPKCEHEFIPNSEEQYTIDDFENKVNHIETLRESIKGGKEEIEFYEDEIKKICECEERNTDKEKHIQSNNKEIESIKKQQIRLLDEHDRYATQEEIIKASKFSDTKAKVKKQIAEKLNERTEQINQMDQVVAQLEHNKQWINHFYDFQFYLGNKPIEIICSLVNQYLKLNNSDLNLHIEGFKKLRSGELRQALQPVIYRNWMSPKSYEQFSEGEKVRLNLAVDLAFQQLINSSSKYGGLNLYVNDELISSLDSNGVSNAAQAFDRLDKTILLVTHSGSDLNYKNVVTIQKKGNKSQLI